MNDTTRAKVIRFLIVGAMIVSLFLVLGAVLQTPTITLTINWVKCLAGILIFMGALVYALTVKGGKSE